MTHGSVDKLIDLMTLYRTESGMRPTNMAQESLRADLTRRSPEELVDLAHDAVHALATLNWPNKRYERIQKK